MLDNYLKNMKKLYRAIVLNPKSDYQVECFPKGALLVDEQGKVVDCGEYCLIAAKYEAYDIIDCSGKLLMPGLIDLHTHLPQFTSIGRDSAQLLDWLNNTIFPKEKEFYRAEIASKYSKLFFENMLKSGTTTAVIYTSNSIDATHIAFEIAEKYGVRAFIGKSMMDQNVPDWIKQTAKENIDESVELAKKWHKKGRLQYIFTPRFAVSCSLELMKLTAEVAKSDGFFVQTHLSENTKEIAIISQMYPEYSSYTEVYSKCGLLNERTIFAHCIYLSDLERNTLKNSGAIIAHCPTSNRYLASGIMPLTNYLQSDLRIGLGTDVAAGYSLSIISEAREAIENSKYYSLFKGKCNWLTPSQAICLATIKAAECLNMSNEIGNFDKGKSADFAIFNMPDYFVDYSEIDAILSAAIYNLDNPKATNVFIEGKQVV